MKKKAFSILAALTILAMRPHMAYSACSQADVTGRWRVYMTRTSGGNTYWVKGTIIVSPAGKVNAGTTFIDPYGNVTTTTGGSITVYSNCRMAGTVIDDDFDTIPITEAWMTKGKDYFSGVVSTGTVGENASFSATKY